MTLVVQFKGQCFNGKPIYVVSELEEDYVKLIQGFWRRMVCCSLSV